MTRPHGHRRTTLALLLAALVSAPGAAHAAGGDPGPDGLGTADVVGPVAQVDPGVAAAPVAPSASGSITVRGHGYGHGHGMSQYGAKGAAQKGWSYRRIISFYYPGTRWATVRGRVQVLVTADTSPDLVVEDRSGLRVRPVGSSGWSRLAAKGAQRWRITPGADGGSVVSVQRSGSWRVVRRYGREAELSAGGAPMRLVKPSGSTAYRGLLRSVVPPARSSDGPRDRDTVNVVSVENYLRGVVPLEMPALWSPQAVRAQAVAARSYVAYERAHPRNTHYQVCDTTSCQVYGGADAEHPASDAAIRATRRVARYAGGKPALTQFSSSNGGWTAKGGFAYLPAKRDTNEVGSGNTYATWTRTVSRSAIESWRPAIGSLRAVRPGNRDGHGEWNGRVGTVALVGSRATVTVSGDEFRFGFGLPSTWFTTG